MTKFEHDAAAAKHREQVSTLNKPWYRSCSQVLESLPLQGGKAVDLCSGNVEYSRVLRDCFKMDVVCADYIPHHIKKATEQGFPTLNIDLDGDWKSIESAIADHIGKYDLVVNLAAVEHVFCSDNLMGVAHKLLKPGGLFVINTPNIEFLGYRLYSLLNGNRPFGEGHHIRFWDYRFLRTCLYFNGFEINKDSRKFFSLPEEAMRRAFKNRLWVSRNIAKLFYCCFLFQKIPFFRGWATDELTLLCRKEELVPVPFDYLYIRSVLEDKSEEVRARQNEILDRLTRASNRGWLKEHIYMSELVEKYI